MIKVFCTTNLDEYRRVQWPTKMYYQPHVGDYVQSVGSLKSLRIHNITHIPNERGECDTMKLELHR